MEVGTEISQKIRSAIKAKLIELGAYVDDELPDYIMVMVANKKSREQMISDLNLFLGKNTDTFAEWLHGLLGKLQTISVDSSTANKSVKEKKKSDSKKEKKVKKASKSEGSSLVKKVKSKKNESTASTASIDKTLEAQSEGPSDSRPKHTQRIESEGKESQSDSVEVEDVRQMLVTVAPTDTDELAAELETTEARIEQSQQVASQITKSPNTESDKDVSSVVRTTLQRKRSISPTIERRVQSSSAPKKHRGLTSVIASVSVSKDEEDEEYDPLCPAVGSVASVVKVTSRKSKIPPSLQANKALLVKAMGEAERSIAIKRRIIAPRQASREDSPSEVYTPKRKKSSGDAEPSPPPYIPSRKECASVSARVSNPTSQRGIDHRRHEHSDSRSEQTRQTLSSQDRLDLVSRSRRMELLKHIGIDRKEGPVHSSSGGGGSSSNTRHTRQSPKKTDSRKAAESEQRLKLSSSSSREVSGRRRDDDDSGVKDLKIKARLGPAVKSTPPSESRNNVSNIKDDCGGGLDLRSKMTRSTYNKDDSLQIIVNPMTSPALKGSVASRLGKIVVKRRGSDSDGENDNNNSNNECEVKVKGRMAVSRHAKSLVNKQCREAVLSVSAGGRRHRRSVSPDSRRVEAADEEYDDENDEDEDVEDEEDDDDAQMKRSDIVTEVGSVSVTVKQTVTEKDRKDNDVVIVHDDENSSGYGKDSKVEEREPEDLAEMIGEKLEPELLKDTVQDDLNLDIEDVEDADDIETMIGVKSEENKPKPGTRFIVTLDGVDERQLCLEGEGSGGGKNMDSASLIQPRAMVVDPMRKLLPSAPLYIPQLKLLPHTPQQMPPPVGIPMQTNVTPTIISPGAPAAPFSPVVYNIGDSNPPLAMAGIISQGEPPINKPLPPKIQPFSINLKDSDDEFEDKESRMQMLSSASSGYIAQVRQSQSDTSLTSLTALQKAKLSERCKFWPACAAGSECEFHHPTSYCKTFPNCKFADKCLFIHPNCRFDSRCTRQDCPFTHTSRRTGLSSSSLLSSSSAPTIPFHPPKPPPVPATTTICRFYPNCQNPSCQFIHPKPCRFGSACQNPSCLFYHPTPPVAVPTKSKLKWKAQPVTMTQPRDIPSSPPSISLHAVDPAAKFRQPVAKVSPMSAATNSSNIH